MERRLTENTEGIDQLVVLGNAINVVVHAEEGRAGLEADIEAVGSVFEAEARRAELTPFGRELELLLFPVVTRSGGPLPGMNVHGDVTFSADHGSIAAAVVNGPVTLDGGRVAIGRAAQVPAEAEGHLTVTVRIPLDFKIYIRLKGGDITTHGVPESNARLHTDAGTVTRVA
ncbi:hypothetical protein [Actinomadura sp. NPDC049753]|uniref:hypothetical protein n=1 Tax=Actinomadura sp. NPDC049753 TaxID=3154739 RepID=UPI0034402824